MPTSFIVMGAGSLWGLYDGASEVPAPSRGPRGESDLRGDVSDMSDMLRCARCPGAHSCLPPDGPPSADILFIGEAPGKEEERLQRPFVGRTGREVNDHYLPVAGLRRSGVMFTNSIACLPATAQHKLDPSREKDVALLDTCTAAHLYPLIERGRWRLLVPMGAFACHAVCPDVDLERQHGFPVATDWGIPAFPLYHPARGLHEPKKMLQIRTDWVRLRRYLRGGLVIPTDEYGEGDYAEVVDSMGLSLDPTRPIACDTEHSRSLGPYVFTYSQDPGTGRLIRASRPDLLAAFQDVALRWESVVLFHNWLYDERVTREMGLTFPPHALRDTMMLAYHLGNIPQGLKVLAWRELGMDMQDFDDVVRPHSTRRVLEYYERAALESWPMPEPRLERDAKTQRWKLYTPQGMNTKLKRFITDRLKHPDKDVFAAWDNWEEEQAMIEDVCGPWPGLDIAHAPLEQVIRYACRDADATIRLWPLLERMRANVHRGLPPEEWGTA